MRPLVLPCHISSETPLPLVHSYPVALARILPVFLRQCLVPVPLDLRLAWPVDCQNHSQRQRQSHHSSLALALVQGEQEKQEQELVLFE